MIQEIAFVAHPTADMTSAKQFYTDVLGLKLDSEYGESWAEFATPDGKVIALHGYPIEGDQQMAPYVALEIDDLDTEMERIRATGSSILRDITDHGTCRMALLADPSDNIFMLHEMSAKRKAKAK
jgi:predicted enzyme related to lactoylglutathione lyase